MKARIHIPKKTYVISVSLMKGCYRHIKIASNKTLDDLSSAILAAFDFDNDHLHAFFMDNKRWSHDDSYFLQPEYGERDTTEYKLAQVGLEKDKKFLYLFDFGDEWWFSCKVLRVIDGVCEDNEVVRSVGDAPDQYPDYDDYEEEFDEDEDDVFGFEPYPDSLYAAAFRFRDTKLWENLKKEDVFAVKMFDGEVCYCSVYADEPPTFFVFDTPYGLYEYLKPHDAGEGTPKEYMEYICLQDHISCAFAAKDMVDPHSAELAKDYAKKNKISMRGKHAYPYMARDVAGHFPFVIVADFERRYLEDALNAATLLSVILEHNDKGAVGFGKESTMPLFEYTAKDGDAIKEIEYPPKPEPNHPAPKARKYKKKLPHKGIYECDIVYAPAPAEEIVGVVRSAVPYGVTFMAVDTDEDGEFFYTDMYSGYERNCEAMLEAVINDFEQDGFVPEEIRIVDERTDSLLGNFCYINGIKLTRVQEFEVFEQYRGYYISSVLDETSDELDDEHSAEEMFDEICVAIRELSEEQLATMPKELYDQVMTSDLLPDDLQAKLRRSRIKRNK
ncbi:pRiA4b ORF-3-like protein [Ruminococcus sp. YE71]|uniref:IS1096 element passenger TnpR family protein n=1 Tax=unclassified Ruminococcus TaxID=2608920 RepID=UPI000880A7B5|nr:MULTISPECIES: hypothetical protein [unclassified Ruminococcus]SDA32902.1 pRiA4b ORF-3-like protein [Ruminococcus sp. YE78]SFW53917.1 pRiA4b ORF-3-like protein [Ruminococcus sp. YE71]